ncbi:sigma-70 family RNA polymerase sigma factor [Hoyosella sp. G463]|uniref:Sigma-70 family RNA polymerase sigma factor n=1 Tax=Lolliginicoccus lacisalsi TaxID=2742202 RepID=A0A927JD37_9ACTN|nr:sigma-70 family RNA polymerase sigma factor [Lolliginicoccus lacisalsi]MBD8507113.1 sigma-70 family RNA polymerase sigma factor [Lolliginicoccus lacisalsi]
MNPLEVEQVNKLLEKRAALPHGDPAAEELRAEIVTRCLGLARNIASRFRYRGEDPDDVLQVASLALIVAVDRFDSSRGSGFIAFAVPTIVGEIRHHLRDKRDLVRVPRHIHELRARIAQEVPALAQSLGRTPSPQDLATAVGTTVEDITEAMHAGSIYHDAELGDLVHDHDADHLAIDQRMDLAELVAILPDREKTIVRMRFLEERTQSEIAHCLGISQVHVSRLLARALECLRERARPGV